MPTIDEEVLASLDDDDAVSVVDWTPCDYEGYATQDSDTMDEEHKTTTHLWIDVAAANATANFDHYEDKPLRDELDELKASVVSERKRKCDAMDKYEDLKDRYDDLENDLANERKRKCDAMETHEDLLRNLRTAASQMVAPVIEQRFLDACLIGELTSGAFEC